MKKGGTQSGLGFGVLILAAGWKKGQPERWRCRCPQELAARRLSPWWAAGPSEAEAGSGGAGVLSGK